MTEMAAPRPSVEALGYVAEWIDTYEFDNEGEDSPRAQAFAAFTAWVEHLENEQAVREVARSAAARVGRKANDPAVIAAARRALAEQAAS